MPPGDRESIGNISIDLAKNQKRVQDQQSTASRGTRQLNASLREQLRTTIRLPWTVKSDMFYEARTCGL